MSSQSQRPPRVGIVSYFAPPQQAVAAHRVLRLTRCLLAHGATVHWVTQDPRRVVQRDESLASLVPAAVRVHGLAGPSLASRPAARNLFEWVGRNLAWYAPRVLAVPDSHLQWAWRLSRGLPRLVAREALDAVLFCCGPHGQILAIPRLRRRCPQARIVVDYRDLLTGNPWQPGGEGVRRRLAARERRVLAMADALFVNTEVARERFHASLGPIDPCPVQVMRNTADFDLADEILRQGPAPALGPGVHLGYFGTLFPRRNLRPVLAALGRLPPARRDRFTLHCYCGTGASAAVLQEDCAAVDTPVATRVVRYDLQPFQDAMRAMHAMHALVLVNGPTEEDRAFVPGKLYDYLMARRPVLFVGEPGDASRIVGHSSGDDWCFRHGDLDGIAQRLDGLQEARPPDLRPAQAFAPDATFQPLLELLGLNRCR